MQTIKKCSNDLYQQLRQRHCQFPNQKLTVHRLRQIMYWNFPNLVYQLLMVNIHNGLLVRIASRTLDCNRSSKSIQKLHLRTSLKDEPARLLTHLSTSSANYEVAFKLLEDGFANKRMIPDSHLESIFDFRPLTEQSPDQLRKLMCLSGKHYGSSCNGSRCWIIWLHMGAHHPQKVG